MKRKITCFIILIFSLVAMVAAQDLNVIPRPKAVEMKPGVFALSEKTTIRFSDPKLEFIANYVSGKIRDLTGLPVPVKIRDKGVPPKRSIDIDLDPGLNIPSEGYELTVSPTGITVRATEARGAFYGVQTLLQLLPLQGLNSIPALVIQDSPRFSWRGLLLDVSRHFFTLDELKRLIDEMVVYKFNVLQLHLTDDQGWRLEIKKKPELTRTGAWRAPRTGLWWERECTKEGEEATYGGFYTQDQIRDLVAYATLRCINILPEIEAPGHSMAAIASYPYLSSTGLPYKVNQGCPFYGIEDNSLCAGKESTFEYLEAVLSEVASLFPFEYVHIGGDECYKGFWEKCDQCRKRMVEYGLKDLNELQSYVIKRMEKILESKGKKLIGWDEILEGGLAPNAAVMSWRGMDGGIAAARAGHNVVMSPVQYAYIDYYQGDPAIEPPTFGMLRLNKVYSFEPVPDGVDPSYILGGQGNLWSESVPVFRHAEYMLWPRSFALAEVLWSPKDARDWSDFIRRTESHLQRLDASDINHALSYRDAIIIPSRDPDGNLLISLDTELDGIDLYYTFDNTYPDPHSARYTKDEKLAIPGDADTFRVITYKDGKSYGRVITVPLADLEKRAPVK